MREIEHISMHIMQKNYKLKVVISCNNYLDNTTISKKECGKSVERVWNYY